MLSNFIKVCKVFPYTEDDADLLYKNYSNSAVDIIESDIELGIMPSIIIGWERVKKLFPNQSIMNKKIEENIFWTYSVVENKEEFNKDVDFFIKSSIKNYFSKSIKTYDAIVDGELNTFLLDNINPKIRTFIYFHKNAIYFHNEGRNCAISLVSLEFVGKDYKKIITSLINKIECTIFSYYNSSKYIYQDIVRDVMTTENNFWSKYNHHLEPREFIKIFLGEDIHKFIPLIMKIVSETNPLTHDETNSCKRQAKKDKITSWLSTNRIYFNKFFKIPKGVRGSLDGDKKYLELRYSDKKTITGRINCIDSFNPQMIPKDSPIRKEIVSRFNNGKIVVFDYKSFETRLSMYLSRDEEFIISNMNSDLHFNTAKAIFGNVDINSSQRDVGKNINHTILYGGGEKLLKDIIQKGGVIDIDLALKNVKHFLNPILSTTDYINDVYKELGYIINPFGTLVRPNKTYAAFNNYVQSTAADIVIDKLFEIKEFLKNKESKFMFQVYDSFVFDISPKDENLIQDLNKMLGKYNDMLFDIEYISGSNYSFSD